MELTRRFEVKKVVKWAIKENAYKRGLYSSIPFCSVLLYWLCFDEGTWYSIFVSGSQHTAKLLLLYASQSARYES